MPKLIKKMDDFLDTYAIPKVNQDKIFKQLYHKQWDQSSNNFKSPWLKRLGMDGVTEEFFWPWRKN